MRIVLAVLMFASLAFGQTPAPVVSNFPAQWAGATVNWNQFAAPQINGGVLYAVRITDNNHPTYSFSMVDFLSIQKSPFQVVTTTETGIAQHIQKFGRFDIFGLGTMGPSFTATPTGTQVGTALSGGGFAMTKIRGGWTGGLVLKIIRPTMSDGKTQWSVGLIGGWGK